MIDLVTTNKNIDRFNQLRDSRNEAWLEGKFAEESWAETFNNEFEQLKRSLNHRLDVLDSTRATASDCSIDECNPLALDLWEHDFGAEYRELELWYDNNKGHHHD